MEGLIFLGEVALATTAMVWARWRFTQMIFALIASILFFAAIEPIWNERHTSIMRTAPSLFFMPWVALAAILLILFTGLIALAVLIALVAIGYGNLYSN